MSFRQSAMGNAAFNVAFNKGSFADIFLRMGTILQIGIEQIKNLAKGKLTDENVEAIITEAEHLYDMYIGPIDLPWVPNTIIEPMVDAQIRSMIRPNLLAVAKWLRDQNMVAVAEPPFEQGTEVA
jgi:hypothetical protein